MTKEKGKHVKRGKDDELPEVSHEHKRVKRIKGGKQRYV